MQLEEKELPKIEEEIETSFKIAAQKKQIIEELVTLEKPVEESTITIGKPKEPEKIIEEVHQEIKITKKKKSIPEIKQEDAQQV